MKRIAQAPASRSPWVWAAMGALLGLIVVPVVMAPARWLTSTIEQASGGRIQLFDPRGSIWDGSAQLVLTGGVGSSDAVALPGRVSWHLRPIWRGGTAHIVADCCTREPLALKITALGNEPITATLTNSQSEWPAALLTGLGTPWNTIRPQGQLAVATHQLGVQWVDGRPLLMGDLQLDAVQISTRLSTLVPMGSYRVNLAGGAAPSFQLSTVEGSLQLNGQGQWIGGALRFKGEASASPGRVEALSNLLNIIGRRDGARSTITVG